MSDGNGASLARYSDAKARTCARHAFPKSKPCTCRVKITSNICPFDPKGWGSLLIGMKLCTISPPADLQLPPGAVLLDYEQVIYELSIAAANATEERAHELHKYAECLTHRRERGAPGLLAKKGTFERIM